MNKLFIRASYIIALMCSLVIFSCKKYTGDTYDFSDSKGNYIIFSSTKSIVINGTKGTDGNYIKDTISGGLKSRVNFAYTVDYTLAYNVTNGKEVDISGDYAQFSTSSVCPLYTTDDMFPTGQNKITGTIVLKNATGKYGNLTLGYPDTATGVKIQFTAYKPGTN